LLVFFAKDGFLVVFLLLMLLALLASIPLFLFEALGQFLSPRLQRDLINFRYKPKRAIPKLISHLSLDVPRSKEELQDRAQRLAKAANAVTLRHPNPFYGPIRKERLAKALHAGLIPANWSFADELRKAWIAPKPTLSPGGLILRLRAAIGRLLFGRWLSVARPQSLTGASSVIFGLKGHDPDQPWKTRDFPNVMTFLAWKSFADGNDMDVFGSDPLWLPLGHQRKLAAIAAQLHGTPTQALLARFLNPSHFGALQKLADDRAKWQPWDAEQRKAHAATEAERAAERAEQDRYRQKDSLTPDEVTALVAEKAQDSILLNRLWPPGAPVTTNSWLGGLPCLPPDIAWPQNHETSLPLHFLAQVDCADLPTLDGTSPLPRDGLLLFFSDLDEERLSESDAVVYVTKAQQDVPPRALPDNLPEIDHSSGKPTGRSNGQRNFPKWPVVPTAVKIWGDSEEAHPKTFNRDYLKQSHAAHTANLAALMPPPAKGERLADMFPRTYRKDAEGKPVRDEANQLTYDTAYDPLALPAGFPWCGAGIDAFVKHLRQQSLNAEREAKSARSYVTAKWNDTDEKRQKAAAEADRKDAHAAAMTDLAEKARTVLGTRPALSPVDPAVLERLHTWLASLPLTAKGLLHAPRQAVSDSILDLARQAVTDPGLLALMPPAAFAIHADWLTPSPEQSQHLMLGPAQVKTNSTAGSGIRLLCLDSDYGPGMMFCDCGVVEYWIDPADLAARRFDRAYASTAGG
jgi:hypothetical protein